MKTLKHLPLVAALLLVSQVGSRLEAGPVSGVDSVGHPPPQQTQQQTSDKPSPDTSKKTITIKSRPVNQRITRAETQGRINQLIAFDMGFYHFVRKSTRVCGLIAFIVQVTDFTALYCFALFTGPVHQSSGFLVSGGDSGSAGDFLPGSVSIS